MAAGRRRDAAWRRLALVLLPAVALLRAGTADAQVATSPQLAIPVSGITSTEMVRLPDDTLAVIVLTNLGRRFGGSGDP